jgi:CheY-like chemotaxis protein
VKSLVEMHGGTVRADSAGLDKGSTFTVRIPAELRRPTGPLAGPSSTDERVQGARRIVVVDDNVDAAESLAMFLEMAGHRTRIAHSGPDAIALAAEFSPEVVFLDIGLPGMSGYDVARQLRRQLTVHPLLVAVTGWGTADDKKRAASAGFDFHLTKPVDLQAIETLLARMRSGDSLKAALHDGKQRAGPR